MLPEPLISVYRQYKQDTDAIAAWLASTAVAHGYSRDLLLPGATHQKAPGRLKGKARTNAKKGTTRKDHTYRIPLAHFTALAEYVAAKKAVSVPLSFLATLNRLIRVRGSFGQQLADHGEKLDKESDEKHNFFVGTLERVREVLKPRFPPATNQAATDATTRHATNLFDTLTVYEPSEEFLNAPEVDRPQPAAVDGATYEAQLPTTLWDVLFAVGAMICDLNRLRYRITWIWSNYTSGSKFDLAAAAIATNAAVDLARNIAEDVMPLTEDHGGPGRILQLSALLQGMIAGHSLEELATPNIYSDFNYKFYDSVAVRTFLPAYWLVEEFAKDLQPGQLPLYGEDMLKTYNPRENRAEKSGYEKYIEDRTLLMAMFAEAQAAVVGVPDYPVEDGFLQGMRELNQTDEIPFYLIFAAQIFLDIHHVLREDTGVAFKTFERQLKSLTREIDIHLEFHKRLETANWSARNNQLIGQVQEAIATILDDPIYEVKSRTYKALGTPMPHSVERNMILKMSPVLSGLMLYRFSWKVREIGLAVVDSWGSVVYTAHLYNALRAQRLVSRWPDMDLVRLQVGDSNFFVGDPPTTIDDCLKKFNLQTGMSVAAMTKTRRKNTKMQSNAGCRPINYHRLVPVSRMFEDRYVCNSGRVDWTAQLVDEVIKLSHYEATGSEEEGYRWGSRIGNEAKPQERKKKEEKPNQTPKKDKSANSGSLLPAEELIRLLTVALHNESLERAFPWLLMHRACWELLRSVKISAGPLLRVTFGPTFLENENRLPFLAGWLFTAAASTLDGQPDMEPLVKAAEGANAFIGQRTGRQTLDWLMGIGLPVQFVTEEELEAERGE